jgi:hypothetical protein
MTAKTAPNPFAKRWKGLPPTRRRDFRDRSSAWAAYGFALALCRFGYAKYALMAEPLPQKVFTVYIWV